MSPSNPHACRPAASRRPARNEACWCGSGQKYKKCHLLADEGGGRAPEPVGQPLFQRVQSELADTAMKQRDTSDFAEAFLLYTGLWLEELEEPDEDLLAGFLEWYIHDYRPASTGRTVIEEYIRKHERRLGEAERALLDSYRQARFGLWEVQRVEEGTGVEVKEIFDQDSIFVHDVSSSRSVIRWDCVLMRVHESGGKWYFVGNGTMVRRNLLTEFIEGVERESRDAGQDPAAFLRANSHRWYREVHELAKRKLADLRVLNAEGDELVLAKAEYEISDRPAVIAALRAAHMFEEEDQPGRGIHAFGWLEQGVEGPRLSYGRIEVRRTKLRLECNSRKRLAIGRQLVEKHSGPHLRHCGDSFETMEDVKRSARKKKAQSKTREESHLPPEVEREILAKIKREHYERWVDMPLPGLGGRTPREAARSKTGRCALEMLLRDMENREERTRREAGTTFDFGAVRKSLGM